MKILVACEYSGVVREAFSKKGHDAWSCDYLQTEIDGNHIQKNVLEVIGDGWDLMIAHPPCTHLAICGARWFKDKINEQKDALVFVSKLMNANIEMICIENPVSVISSKIRKPDQIIQPYNFGDKQIKKTCLWLKNLPVLLPTEIVKPEYDIVNSKTKKKGYSIYPKGWGKGIRSSKERSRFFPGVAKAMADQWG